MNQLAIPPTAIPGAATFLLETFFAQVRDCNPFLVNRVDRPLAEDLLDVFGIHEPEFRRILNLGRQAHQTHQGIGVAVLGEAGVGKTHLLARLGHWAREHHKAQFVYLHNLQADPERIPRGLLQAILGVLTGGRQRPQYRSPLFALLNSALRVALPDQAQKRPSWEQLATAFQHLVRDFAARDPSRGVLFDRDLYHVLFRYYQAAHPSQRGKGDGRAELALRWLAGERLLPTEQEQLRLRGETSAGSVSAAGERQHVKRVLAALTQLAASAGQWFLLCLDQVDNLEEEQIRALARFLHDLLDSAGNLLVVTTGVRETLLGFLSRGVITETSWDRLGQVEISLNRIPVGRGRELLLHRLQNFMVRAHSLPTLQECIARDPLFPLESVWFEERVKRLLDLRPRDLLAWAAQRWQQHQETLSTTPGTIWLARLRGEKALTNGQVGNDDKSTVMDRAQETQVQKKASLPPNEERLREVVSAFLLHSLQNGQSSAWTEVQQPPAGNKGTPPLYDILFHQPSEVGENCRSVGLRFLISNDGRTTVSALRRLLDDPAPPHRVLLITEERQPLALGTKGRELLEKLSARGAERFQQLILSRLEFSELERLAGERDAGAIANGTVGSQGGEHFQARGFLQKLLGSPQ